MANARAPGILVITWNFPPKLGGMENLIGGLCEGLRKKSPVLVIAPYAKSGEGSSDWIFRSRWPGLLAFSLFAVIQGFFLLRRNPAIRVVLGGSAMVIPLVLVLARSFRRKAVVNVHGSDLIHSSIVYQSLCVRWIRHCDAVIANSHYTASLAAAKGVRERSSHVIPPGIDWDDFPPVQPEQERAGLGLNGRKVLLYVGRLTRRKGVKEFIRQCLPRIVRHVPEAVFVIVGVNPSESLIHHDDLLSEIEAVARETNLTNQVRFMGQLTGADLARAYGAADLLVLPVIPMDHDVEGFGIVILEAAAAGKPCVATRVGGIPDAVEEGKGGVLVVPGDYEEMSRAILGLLRDDSLRHSMGRYAKERAQRQFRWPSIVSRYEEVFSLL